MSTTPTANYGFSKITAGTEKDVWGPIQSTTLDGIDTQIKNRQNEAAAAQTTANGKANASHTHAQADVTNLTTDLAAKAPLASPPLTGTPTAPTAAGGTNTTQIATTAFVTAAVAAAAPAAGVEFPTSNYTLDINDGGKLIGMNMAGANTWTIPPNSSVAFSVGTEVHGGQYGAGQTTVTPGVGVTIRASGGALKSAVRYAGWTAKKIATDEWWVFGDLTT